MPRSIQDFLDQPIDAIDSRIGKVRDALFDDRYWRLRYLVADTGTWPPGEASIIDIGWGEKTAKVDLLRKQIEMAPKFDPSDPVNQDAHKHLYDYYGRPRYQESLTE